MSNVGVSNMRRAKACMFIDCLLITSASKKDKVGSRTSYMKSATVSPLKLTPRARVKVEKANPCYLR